MIIKLEYEEIKIALAGALTDKTNHMFGRIDPENCTFEISDNLGKNVLIGNITFEISI